MPLAAQTDYLPNSMTLTFLPGSSQVPQCIEISTVNDTVLENIESFTVVFSSQSSVMSESAVVSIQDNDGQYLHCDT